MDSPPDDELEVVDCAGIAAAWTRGPLPDPVAAAVRARATPAVWDAPAWRELLMGVTGRDIVALVLAFGLALVLLTIVGAIIRGEYTATSDGLVAGIIGALVVVVARYLGDRRDG